MATGAVQPFFQLVKGSTGAQSLDVESVMRRLDDETYIVPDYQRDSDQWDDSKKSLFVDSLINNMTIPPIIVYPYTDPTSGAEKCEIVDGQQRLTTIRDFLKGSFALSPESDTDYAENVGPLVQERRFAELPEAIQKCIKRYMLNVIVLPKDLELGLRLEIFRRINEAGVPLSPQDLRLAVFGQSQRVYFVRLAGVFDPTREGASRIIRAANDKHGLDYPWSDSSAWKDWWADSVHAGGQGPSQMFLYYVLARDLQGVEKLLASDDVQSQLRVRYNRTTISVLDLYLAQLQSEDRSDKAPRLLADLQMIRNWFKEFEIWFNAIKQANVPSIATNSSTKIALFIAAATEVWHTPERIKEHQWQLIQILLTKGPSKIEEVLGASYPIAKGKWPGQRSQIEKILEVCRIIAKK